MGDNDCTHDVRRVWVCGWVYAAHVRECLVVNRFFKYYYFPDWKQAFSRTSLRTCAFFALPFPQKPTFCKTKTLFSNPQTFYGFYFKFLISAESTTYVMLFSFNRFRESNFLKGDFSKRFPTNRTFQNIFQTFCFYLAQNFIYSRVTPKIQSL